MRALVPFLHGVRDSFPPSSLRIACVYISEAHATDEWPIRSSRFLAPGSEPVCVKQAVSSQDRFAAARQLVSATGLELDMFCADIEGEFERLYNPWPIRFFVLRFGILEHVGVPKEAGPDLVCLRKALDRVCLPFAKDLLETKNSNFSFQNNKTE
jgi:hypothetical protein